MYNKKKSHCKTENNEFKAVVQSNEHCKGVKLNS